MNTILLRGGTLIDGTGAPPVTGDLLIDGDRIAAVGRFAAPPDARVIDCTGLAVSPGFIDAHSHSDLQVLDGRPEKALQGVTTEVVGNCGFSAYPAPQDRRPLHEFANGILCGDDQWGWATARDYLAEVRRRAPLANVLSLVGHGTLRIAHPGYPLDAMERSLDEALSQGAAGFSTGLMYAPGQSAPREELERLCRVVARHGKVYTTHMRDYGRQLEEAVQEQIDLARRPGCRLQISHLQAAGSANWPRQARALELIEQALKDGVDIAFDCYPYLRGSTVLTQLLPQWTLEEGVPALMARLADAGQRARIARETIAGMAHRWSELSISAVAGYENRSVVGRTIQDIAEARGRDPIDVVFDLLIEEHGAVNMLEINQSEENLRAALCHPLSIVVSDGFYVRGRPHPRLHGAFPELLGKICREQKWMTLSEAVRKITGQPAERFRISRRGLLQPGFYADVTIFDPATVASPATYEDPERAPVGVHGVLRNGNFIAAAPTA